MKLSRLIFAFCLMSAVLANTACDEYYVGKPYDLVVMSVTATSARLQWSGRADSYEVRFGSDIVPVISPYVVVDNLMPDTYYSWSVRAVDGTETSAWVSGPGFRTISTPAIMPSINVNFGRGLEVWSAGDALMETSASANNFTYSFTELTRPQKEQRKDFVPAVEGRAVKDRDTVFPNDAEATDNFIYLDYFSRNYWNRDMRDEVGGFYYGDWEAVSGRVRVTAVDHGLVSGVIDAVMRDAYDFHINGNRNPVRTPLTVTFSMIPIDVLPASAAVRRAIRSGNRVYEFDNSAHINVRRR